MRSSSERISDALWDGVRHEPPVAQAVAGPRSWYLSRIYHPVIRARRERIWAHRSPEPWLSVQWLMERAAGEHPDREYLRYDGLPGQHSYDKAFEAVREGCCDPPFLFVAGYSRSGTTSVQNLVLNRFAAHLPPGRWSDPDHPLRLWWYPKHRAQAAARIAAVGPDDARVVVCIRPFVDAAGSLAIYTGRAHPELVSADWVQEQLDSWTEMAAVCDIPGVVVLTFDTISTAAPSAVATAIADELGIESGSMDPRTTWSDVYREGISPEVLDDPRLSNLPHSQRSSIGGAVRSRVHELVGRRLGEVEETYARAAANALCIRSAEGLDAGFAPDEAGPHHDDQRSSATT